MVAAGARAVRRRAAALAVAVALGTTGCGLLKASEPEAVAQPGTVATAPDELGPGPYALTTEAGAVITFDLPTVPAPDDEVERLRQDLAVEPVTYVELHIDNTEGTRTVRIDDLKVIGHEGGQFPFEPAAEILSDWDPDRSGEGGYWRADGSPLDAQEGAELDARTHALVARHTGAVPAGETGRELMIGDFERLPKSFDDVELSPYPNDRALDPAPVGHGPAQRQYRAGVPTPSPRDRIEAEPEPGQHAAQPPRVPAAPAPGPEPDQPVDPAEPQQPVDPAVPVEPQRPVEPRPAEPQQPVDPAQPQPPTEPQQPQQPVEPQPPVDPVVPVEPQQPVEPSQPVDPAPTPLPTTPPVQPPLEPAGNPGTGADGGREEAEGTATAGASAPPSPSPSGRPNWPPSPVPAPSPSVAEDPSSSLPSGVQQA